LIAYFLGIFDHIEKYSSTFKGRNSITIGPNLKVYSSKFKLDLPEICKILLLRPRNAAKNSKVFFGPAGTSKKV